MHLILVDAIPTVRGTPQMHKVEESAINLDHVYAITPLPQSGKHGPTCLFEFIGGTSITVKGRPADFASRGGS